VALRIIIEFVNDAVENRGDVFKEENPIFVVKSQKIEKGKLVLEKKLEIGKKISPYLETKTTKASKGPYNLVTD